MSIDTILRQITLIWINARESKARDLTTSSNHPGPHRVATAAHGNKATMK
jgi:hypothetical protein